MVILDLDDTLIRSYDLLIVPLERDSARDIAALPGIEMSAADLTEMILELRRRAPNDVEAALASRFPRQRDEVIEARRRVFRGAVPDRLYVDEGVLTAVARLRQGHSLVLMTEGDPVWQRRKVDHLGLARHFDELVFVDPAAGETKEDALVALGRRTGTDFARMIVVGNRLDKEIAAGRRLGTRTIWLRTGEGRHLQPDPGLEPDVIVERFTEVPAVVERLASV